MNKRRKPTRKPLSDNVQSLRMLAGMSQFQLAAESGVKLTTLCNIEQGVTQDPKVNTVAALAKSLGVTVGQLLGLESMDDQ